MNPVADEMRAILEGGESLMHIGMPRRSGRYPWGSGDDPYQNAQDFLGRVKELRKEGFTFTDENGKTWTGDNAIAKSIGLTSSQFRTELSLANDERKIYQQARIKSLRDDGLGWTEIGRKMNMSESTVRSMMDEDAVVRTKKARETAEAIKKEIDARAKEDPKGHGMIDIGKGVERELNISKEKLNTAIHILQKDGYMLYVGGMDQPTNKGQRTTQKVLCSPETEHKEIYELDRVHSLKQYISRDDGKTLEKKFTYPESLDSKRLMIRYADDKGFDGATGNEKDGLVELRRNVPDLSLGNDRYSQVRIMVDGTHYIKGMAVYSDKMPDGVDVVFNTNKKRGTPTTDVLKKIKEDPDNPFGSLIKDADQGGQYWYDADTGQPCSANDSSVKNKKLGLINKRASEGDWSEWKDALPSQFLGKQSKALAKKQLDLAKADKLAEYEAICELDNPTIKKHLLQKFSDECDSAAVQLQAAALPGQKYHVIIPINSLKENEVYAPKYQDGTEIALIRYPHAGTFEIPILKVNNKHRLSREILGTDQTDAIGINKKVADQLSGADFDGDTVMCIPTNDPAGKVKITATHKLKKLEDFEPKTEYGYDQYKKDADGTEHYYRNGREFKVMKNTNIQMGVISNLITDMTLAGASEDELARAVRHSMVVIDAEKHKLDYRKSAIDNNIAALHKDYQGKSTGGAATILSRAKGEADVLKRQGVPKVNIKGKDWYDPTKPEGSLIYKTADDLYYPDSKRDKKAGTVTLRTSDGKKITYKVDDKDAADKYKPVKKIDPDTGEVTYTNKAGDISYKLVPKTQKSTRMAETDDAYSLVSEGRHQMELIYADYANSMKALANKARLEMVSTKGIQYSAAAKDAYREEVSSLKSKINNAELNYARERAAVRKANVEIANKKKAYLEKNGVDMPTKDVKKISQIAMTKYRQEVASISRRDREIDITDREWQAIQAGAISDSQLKLILKNTDIGKLRERATPRTHKTLSAAQVNRVKAYAASNYTLDQIAEKMGVSASTISKYLKGVN